MDAMQEFLTLRDDLEAQGVARADAVARINLQRPDLRLAMIAQANAGRDVPTSPQHRPATNAPTTSGAGQSDDARTLGSCKLLGPASNAFWSAVEIELKSFTFAKAVERAIDADPNRNARRLAEETAALARSRSSGGF